MCVRVSAGQAPRSSSEPASASCVASERRHARNPPTDQPSLRPSSRLPHDRDPRRDDEASEDVAVGTDEAEGDVQDAATISVGVSVMHSSTSRLMPIPEMSGGDEALADEADSKPPPSAKTKQGPGRPRLSRAELEAQLMSGLELRDELQAAALDAERLVAAMSVQQARQDARRVERLLRLGRVRLAPGVGPVDGHQCWRTLAQDPGCISEISGRLIEVSLLSSTMVDYTLAI